jgi:hypothetical protein
LAQVRKGAPFYVEQAPAKTQQDTDLDLEFQFPNLVPGTPEFSGIGDGDLNLPQEIPVSPVPESKGQDEEILEKTNETAAPEATEQLGSEEPLPAPVDGPEP